MRTISKRLPIPEGVTAGAVIGEHGRHIQIIRAAHNVKCSVETDRREVVVTGFNEDVAEAVVDFHALFKELLASQAASTPMNAVGQPFVHYRATLLAGDEWQFVLRDAQHIDADREIQRFQFRLHCNQTTDQQHAALRGSNNHIWLHSFDAALRDRMANDVDQLTAENGARSVHVKAVVGHLCFKLPDQSLAGVPLTWEKLQSLRLVNQFKPRWSNVWNRESDHVETLLDQLEGSARDQSITTKSILTVYVGTLGAKSYKDDVIKYEFESGTWVPLTDARDPHSVHSQCDVIVDNATCVRIQSFSENSASNVDKACAIAQHLEIVEPVGGSVFEALVRPRQAFPRGKFVRRFGVKEKLVVDWQGLQFTISYMDKQHTSVSLECRLEEARKMGPGETMRVVTDKIVELTTGLDEAPIQ